MHNPIFCYFGAMQFLGQLQVHDQGIKISNKRRVFAEHMLCIDISLKISVCSKYVYVICYNHYSHFFLFLGIEEEGHAKMDIHTGGGRKGFWLSVFQVLTERKYQMKKYFHKKLPFEKVFSVFTCLASIVVLHAIGGFCICKKLLASVFLLKKYES